MQSDGFLPAAYAVQQIGQAAEGGRCVRMAGPEGLLIHPQGPPEDRFGLGVVALRVKDGSIATQGRGQPGVLGARGFLNDRQGLGGQTAGRRQVPCLLVEPAHLVDGGGGCLVGRAKGLLPHG